MEALIFWLLLPALFVGVAITIVYFLFLVLVGGLRKLIGGER